MQNLIDNKVFPDKLRKARALLQLTQAQMAGKIGITTAAYSNWETGKRTPRLNYIKVISDATGIPLSYFVDPQRDIDLDLGIDQQALQGEIEVPIFNSELLARTADIREIWKSARRYSVDLFRKADQSRIFAFKIADASMQATGIAGSRTIVKGSVAIARACSPAMKRGEHAGSPAVVSYKGNPAIVREINWDGDGVILRPWNSDYHVISCLSGDVACFGEVLRSVISYA